MPGVRSNQGFASEEAAPRLEPLDRAAGVVGGAKHLLRELAFHR
jgi:hypothetical protein